MNGQFSIGSEEMIRQITRVDFFWFQKSCGHNNFFITLSIISLMVFITWGQFILHKDFEKKKLRMRRSVVELSGLVNL